MPFLMAAVELKLALHVSLWHYDKNTLKHINTSCKQVLFMTHRKRVTENKLRLLNIAQTTDGTSDCCGGCGATTHNSTH